MNASLSLSLPFLTSSHFSSASKGASGKQKARTLGNQIIRKGWLNVAMSLRSREYWFVLTSESLNWYRDADVSTPFMTSCDIMHPLGERTEIQPTSWRHETPWYRKWQIFHWKEICVCFILYHWKVMCITWPSRDHMCYRNVYKDQDQLQLVAQTEEEMDGWKASFLRAGVYPDKSKESNEPVR